MHGRALIFGARQRDVDAEGRSGARRARRPRSGRPCARRCAGRSRDRGRCRRTSGSSRRRPARTPRRCGPARRARCRCRCRDMQRDLVRAGSGLDHDGDAAGFGELHRIAGEVEQHLAQARGVADQPVAAAARRRYGGDLDALGVGARSEQLDRLLDQRGEDRTAARRARACRPRSWRSRGSPRSATSSVSPDVFTALA